MDRKDRTLILTQTDPKKDFMFNTWIEHGYHAALFFKPQNKIIRAIRRIWMKNKLPARGIWYGGWKYELDKYDTIIFHVSYLTQDFATWIHKREPKLRLIGWYWNKVEEDTIPRESDRDIVEYWSFDMDDCKKYNMKTNIQYYVTPELHDNSREIKSDIYFIGHDVGRRSQILDFKDKAEKQGLQCDFNIIFDKSLVISYSEVQKQVLTSRAILEINRCGQSGYTLRTMESLFFNKKLITDNLAILNAPFYNKNNVFVINHDDILNLKTFIEIPYDESVRKYRNQYSLEQWFNNFFIDMEKEG